MICKQGNPTARQTSKLAERVARELKAAGWRLERMLSDNGNEFRGSDFTNNLEKLKTRHTRIHAGRPQTNGNVEALHKTILDECWRPAFARYIYPRYTGLRRAGYLPQLLQQRPRPPRTPHPRTHPRRHRLPCPKDGGKMSRTCRHISEAAQPNVYAGPGAQGGPRTGPSSRVADRAKPIPLAPLPLASTVPCALVRP